MRPAACCTAEIGTHGLLLNHRSFFLIVEFTRSKVARNTTTSTQRALVNLGNEIKRFAEFWVSERTAISVIAKRESLIRSFALIISPSRTNSLPSSRQANIDPPRTPPPKRTVPSFKTARAGPRSLPPRDFVISTSKLATSSARSPTFISLALEDWATSVKRSRSEITLNI